MVRSGSQSSPLEAMTEILAPGEYVGYQLARKAGVDVPPAKLINLSNSLHTFCVKRFNRTHGVRRFYASAMTPLRKTQSERTGYLDFAQFIPFRLRAMQSIQTWT